MQVPPSDLAVCYPGVPGIVMDIVTSPADAGTVCPALFDGSG